MKKSIIATLLFVFSILLIIKFGRKVYVPILHKIKGKNTVASIISHIEPNVSDRLLPDLQRLHLDSFPSKIKILAFKDERILEIYAQTKTGYQLLKKYPFTAYSGVLGPKVKEGDRQIPEGIYKIEHLNPNSAYYLSLKVDYPNAFDKQKANEEGRSNLGGDIFIHGKAVTIGCIPVGDEAIEEIFTLAKYAFNSGIEVIISPRDFRKNKSYPEISRINWENELYQKISLRIVEL